MSVKRGQPPNDRGWPDVTAVIPTTGRPTLAAAVGSALEQTVPLAGVVISVDGPIDLVRDLPDDPRVTLVSASAYGSGGNAARVAGLEQVRSGLVALLDDDDVWDVHKIEVQLERYLAVKEITDRHVVVACRVREVDPAGRVRDIAPRHILTPGQDVADYLFERTSILRPGGMLNSSMLLFDPQLALQVPFDTTLKRHQDWDWLLRVDSSSAAVVEMVPEVLVDYLVNPTGSSTSSSGGWQNSESWVNQTSDLLTPRQRGEILLSVTLPIALKHKDWLAGGRLLTTALRLKPGWRSVAFGVAHIPLVLAGRAGAWSAAQAKRRAGRSPHEAGPDGP